MTYQRGPGPQPTVAGLNGQVTNPLSGLAPSAAPAAGVPAVAPTPIGHGATITLSQALTTHRGPVREIFVRVPTYGEFIDLGEIDKVYVLELDEGNRPSKMESTMDRQALMRWMVRLTDLEAHVLGRMSMADGRKVETAVRRFVQALAEGNSTGSTS